MEGAQPLVGNAGAEELIDEFTGTTGNAFALHGVAEQGGNPHKREIQGFPLRRRERPPISPATMDNDLANPPVMHAPVLHAPTLHGGASPDPRKNLVGLSREALIAEMADVGEAPF